MSTEFANIELTLIAPSLTNPRKNFNPTKLAELAEDIKRRGIDTPITVRPLPGSRVAGRVPNEGLMLVAGNVFGKQLDDVIKEIKAEVKAKIWPKVTKKPNPATAPAARPEEGAGGLKDKAVPVLKKQPARAAKLSAEEATLGIAAAMQGVEAAASAPWGAVALPAEPAGAVVEDPLFRTAVKVIVRAKKANVRLLIAELSVGPTKALELMDKLEQAGKVSACDERGARKVLVAA